MTFIVQTKKMKEIVESLRQSARCIVGFDLIVDARLFSPKLRRTGAI
jgi:hypothetical protein